MYLTITAYLASTVTTISRALEAKAILAQALQPGPAHYMGAIFFAPLLQAVPNPFCGVYNLVLPWAGGAALLGLLLAVLGFFLRNLAPHASVQLENGLKGVGIGLFLMGLILQPNFLNAVATALGASGMDFNCPANP